MSKRAIKESGRKKSKKSRKAEEDDEELYEDPVGVNTKTEEADVGIIESICLQNFMCHSKLQFTFGPNVNFIIGRNGSGKSAILTGLVIGLGGKANVTNRGSNIKGFIKSGKQTALVRITLRNRGPDAYKPDVYGERITVERRLSIDGTSTYKLKNSNDVVVATKKDELVHIIDQFNIQVGNPVSVLNQETSRSFLNSKSPHDKYLFFLKATQLEEIKHNYASATEKKRLARTTLIKKQEVLPLIEQELKERERIYRTHQCLQEQRKKVGDLRKEFAWAVVIEKEKDAEIRNKTYLDAEKQLPIFTAKVKEFRDRIKECKDSKTGITNQVQAIKVEIDTEQPLSIRAKTEVAACKNELRAVMLTERRIVNELNTTEQEERSLNERINELKSVDQDQFVGEKNIRLEKISQLESEKIALVSKQKTTENEFGQLDQSIANFQEDQSNVMQEERAKNSKLRSLENELGNLESSRTNRVQRYGRFMPQLLDEIDRAFQQNKFVKKPLGPIGAFVSLKQMEWALAVESCLGNLLSSFCCDNHKDEKFLIELFKKVIKDSSKPAIIVSQFQNEVYNVNSCAVRSEEFSSVLQVLEISNPVIANCIIDQRGVESILLIKENDKARHTMMRAVPLHCNETFTMCGDRLYPDPMFRYYSATLNNAKFLSGSVETRITQVKDELEKVKQDQQEIKGKLIDIRKSLQDNKNRKSQADTSLTKLRQSIGRINIQLNELKNFEEPDATDVSTLEDELVLLRQKKQEFQDQLEEKKIIREEMEIKVKEALEKTVKINDKLDILFKQIEPLQEKLSQLNDQEELMNDKHQQVSSRLKEFEKKMVALKKDHEKVIGEIGKLSAMSIQVGNRVETKRASTQVESEIKELEKHLQQEEKRNGNKGEVTMRYLEAKKKISFIKQQIEEIGCIITSIDKGLEQRKEAYGKFRQGMTLRIKWLFLTSLAARKYTGKIEFDHVQGTLNIMVQPCENVEELHHDMRSLSGGERSFSTVCFILALWDAMESPFRILDEYDVFMDMVNRRISMGLMLEMARQKLHHQFIFLTPLDMPVIESSSIIKICAMLDPERGDAVAPSQMEEDEIE